MRLIQIIFLVLATAMHFTGFAQAKGNFDYRDLSNVNFMHPAVQAAQRSLVALKAPGEVELRIRGLSNCVADSYLAIFTVSQVGKTQKEADELLRNRIETIRAALQGNDTKVEVFIDMISFLPIYEIEESKKLFSKSTYNEIPKGFELKKNLHFKYRDSSVLEKLVTVCAEQEIYDIVRVDYFIDDIEKKKAEIIAKAEAMLEAQVTRYKKRLKDDFAQMQYQFGEGFAMYYPVEQYRTYMTYHSNTLTKATGGETRATQQTTAQFFLPRMSKDYDFVINNSMLEPVIQIEYEAVLRLSPKPKEKEQAPKEVIKTEREFFLITPQAEVRKLGI